MSVLTASSAHVRDPRQQALHTTAIPSYRFKAGGLHMSGVAQQQPRPVKRERHPQSQVAGTQACREYRRQPRQRPLLRDRESPPAAQAVANDACRAEARHDHPPLKAMSTSQFALDPLGVAAAVSTLHVSPS